MERKKQITLAAFDAAAAGDQDAIDAILDYYKNDIDALCTKQTRKRNGVLVSHMDEDMRHEVKRRLIADLPNLAEKMRQGAIAKERGE